MNVLLKGKDGSVAVMTLAEGADPEEAVRKFRMSHPKGAYPEYKIVDEVVTPDYSLRDKWKLDKNWNIVV